MTWRISDEDGRDASSRNFGRLALMAIPLALGLGGSAWVGFCTGARGYLRATEQEQRAAVAVGSTERPTAPMKIEIRKQEFCAPVTRADIDGVTLRLYSLNTCGKQLAGMDWHYELMSPNGTILHASWNNQRGNNCPHPRFAGDQAECMFTNVPIDDRAASVRVWTVPYSDK